jgi:hypothetical protein
MDAEVILYGKISASFRQPTEAMMSQVINFNKGNKRRMKRIRWKFNEVISAVVVSLVIFGLCP